MSYAVIFKAKEALSSDGSVVTWEGEAMVVVSEEDGWVPATSDHYDGGDLPEETKLFRTEQSANRFMKKWEGHPWYAEPRSWEVVEVKRKVRRPVLVEEDGARAKKHLEEKLANIQTICTEGMEDRSHGEKG